jgi:hypothetical protein
MDTETASAMRYLQAVADITKNLHALARRLWSWPNVKPWATTLHNAPRRGKRPHWDEEQQIEAVSSAFYVSADLLDGSSIDWWLEISCDENGWLVERAVYRRDPDEDSSHTAVEFPEWRASSLEDLIAFLSTAVEGLAATLDDPALLELRSSPVSTA